MQSPWMSPTWQAPPWYQMHASQMMRPLASMPPVMGPGISQVTGPMPSSLEKRLSEKRGVQAARPATSPLVPPTKEFEGSLKSLSGKHGYGFIACDEVHRMYGRDVYLPKDLVPENVKVLDRLIFTVQLSTKGHLQAKTVE